MENLYTAGQVAELAGVTIRTIRYYDNVGILSPSYHGPTGNRLYDKHDIMRLQEILTLKLIGFSLKEIGEIVEKNSEKNFHEILNRQEEALRKKVEHINNVISMIQDAKRTFDYNSEQWSEFTHIINAVKATEISVNQYKTSTNLKRRISIHEQFSTNKEIGWNEWLSEKMKFSDNIKILEVGCGDGTFWRKNIDKVNKSNSIVLTDIENNMLQDTKERLREYKDIFEFEVVDVCELPYENNSFDVVIANHMMYHVKDIDKALKEIYRVLKPNGTTFISTVGEEHLKELKELTEKIDLGKTKEQWSFIDRFNLETGYEMLASIFDNVEIHNYDDNLFVTSVEPIINYINSMENSDSIIFKGTRLKKLKEELNNIIKQKQGVFITKKTGLLIAKNNKIS